MPPSDASPEDAPGVPAAPVAALPAHSLLDAIVENDSSVIFLKDTEGRYLLVNRHFEDSFQISRAAIVGRTDHAVFPRDVADAFRANDLEVMRTRRPVEFEEQAPYKDGLHTSIVVKFPWFQPDGSLGGVGGIAVDITDRLRAERERKQLEAKMLQAQKLESLGVLAGGIAHDFNNLLAAILANAGLAMRKMAPGAAEQVFVQQIEQIALRAAELTRQMLAYAGRGAIRIEHLQLSALVREMSTLLSTVVTKKAVVVTDFAPGLAPIEGDGTQLRQVVMNLLTNASEALGTQSGTITIRTGELDARAEDLHSPHLDAELPPGRYVFLEVADTGTGMSEQTMARMFDPFFTTKFTGRGLGLAAVLGIVRAHHGTIRVTSTLGEGTTCRVLFPAARAPARAVPDPRNASPRWEGRGRVLIVDDEAAVRRVARSILEHAGYEVREAADGPTALALLRAQRGFSLVILDMTMPRLSGDEVLRALREFAPDLPVVVTSGHDTSELSERFAALSCAAFLEKPFRADDLVRVAQRSALPPGTPAAPGTPGTPADGL